MQGGMHGCTDSVADWLPAGPVGTTRRRTGGFAHAPYLLTSYLLYPPPRVRSTQKCSGFHHSLGDGTQGGDAGEGGASPARKIRMRYRATWSARAQDGCVSV